MILNTLFLSRHHRGFSSIIPRLSSLDSKLCMAGYCIDLHCANPSMLSEFLMYSSYLRMLTKDTHARHFGLHKIFSMELLLPTTLVSFPPPEHIPWFIPSPRLFCFESNNVLTEYARNFGGQFSGESPNLKHNALPWC